MSLFPNEQQQAISNLSDANNRIALLEEAIERQNKRILEVEAAASKVLLTWKKFSSTGFTYSILDKEIRPPLERLENSLLKSWG